MAKLEPHAWLDFGANGYGSDLSGQFWIKQLTRMHQFDDFAREICDHDDWVDAFSDGARIRSQQLRKQK